MWRQREGYYALELSNEMRKSEDKRRTGICHRNLIDLVRVEPYLVPTALEDRRSQPLLKLEGYHSLSLRRSTYLRHERKVRQDTLVTKAKAALDYR
jgi:hypothetical protein